MLRVFPNRCLQLTRMGRANGIKYRQCATDKAAVPPPQAPRTQPAAPAQSVAPAAPAAVAAAAPAAEAKGVTKYLRPMMMVAFGAFMVYNLTLNTENPDSYVSRQLTPKGKAKFNLKTILARVKDTHKAIDRLTDAAHGQQMELFGQMIALETQAKAGKEVKIPPPKISEGLRKAIELRIELELALMRDLHLLLAMEPVTAQMLIKSPDMLGNIKNRILGLDDEDHADMLLRNLKQSALLPVASAARVFVLQFKGDVFATGLNAFREEVTALLSIARPGDEVLIRLNSGGGTVTGYGLGAAQIDRMKKAGYKVSVAVDEVAASGGYLMAAVADRIYASPFAVIGSIGVVMTVPNFAERMQREGVSMEEITAGKFKRTIVPYKKPTYEDRAKVKEEIESVLDLFKAYLTVHRPALNVDALATGETWYGPQALARGLVDELTTFDDLVLQHAAQGKAVYMLSVKPFKPRFPGLMDDTADEQASWVDRAVQMIVGALAKAVVGALQGGLGVDVGLQGEEGQDAYTKHMAYDPIHGSGQGPRF